MFSRQAPLIGESLFLSGMAAPLASAVQNLVGQCRAPITHRGPITLDYTRPNMRLITPDMAKFGYPDLDLPEPENFPATPEEKKEDSGIEDDPDPPVANRMTPFTPPEHRRDELPANNFFGFGGYFGGPYISVDQQNRTISVNNDDKRRHCVFPVNLNRLDVVHSVDFKGRTNYPKFFKFTIEDRQKDTLFILTVNHLQEVSFVSDVHYSGDSLVFERKKGFLFDPKDLVPLVIGIADCEEPA